MKRILFIAQQAFPVRSSECICNSKVAYSLAEAGFKVDVFTYTNKSTYPSDNKVDRILKSSPNLTVYEIEDKNHDYFLSPSKSLHKNIVSLWHLIKMGVKVGYFYNGMANAYDIFTAVKAYVDKLESFPYDLVMTRAYDCEMAAIYLKEKYEVKWIANWNDPYPTCRFPEPYGRGPKTKLRFGFGKIYKKVKELVDYHTFPSERLRNYMLESFDDRRITVDNTAVIPHMAHSILMVKNRRERDCCLRIVSCGSVNSPRNPKLFVMALSKLIKDLQLTPKDIRCFFVGKFDDKLSTIVSEHEVEQFVSFEGSKQYADCLDFISSCDLSLIIEAQCVEGIYLPTKFVDAVQCGVPVFCVSPNPGTLKDMVETYANGYCADNTSFDSILSCLKQAITDFRNGNLPVITRQKLECFFEDNVTSMYKRIFNQIANN